MAATQHHRDAEGINSKPWKWKWNCNTEEEDGYLRIGFVADQRLVADLNWDIYCYLFVSDVFMTFSIFVIKLLQCRATDSFSRGAEVQKTFEKWGDEVKNSGLLCHDVIFSRFYLLATTEFLSKRQITKRSKWFASIYFKPKQQRSIGSQQLEK